MTRTLHLPLPEPYAGEFRCGHCQGRGVTGEQVLFASNPEITVAVDIFCPDCDGCGRSLHSEHCRARGAHVDEDRHGGDIVISWSRNDAGEVTRDDAYRARVESDCFQCSGRGWNVLHAFDDDHRVFYLRMPCGGCATTRMVEISGR